MLNCLIMKKAVKKHKVILTKELKAKARRKELYEARKQARKEWMAAHPEEAEAYRERVKRTATEWAKANRERVRKNMQRWRQANPLMWREGYLRKKYNLTIVELQQLIAQHRNVCALCGQRMRAYGDKGQDAAVVDYDRTRNRVRGLVHRACATRLRTLDAEHVELIKQYLEAKK